MKILNQILHDFFFIVGWVAAMFMLSGFAVGGTMALQIMSVRLGLPPDPELSGPMMIALFIIGFVCLNQLTGGAMFEALGWSDDK